VRVLRRVLVIALLALLAIAPVALSASRRAGPRHVTLAVPVPTAADLTVAEIHFEHGTHSARAVRAAVLRLSAGATGSDLLLAGSSPDWLRGGVRVLVVLVHRPAGGARGTIPLTVTASRSLGVPVVHSRAGVFAAPPVSGSAAPCDLPGGVGALRVLYATGPALTGFSSAQVLAEAWDAACGRAYDAGFKTGVTAAPPTPGTPTGPSPPVPTPVPPTPCSGTTLPNGTCCPPNAMCACPPPCGCSGTNPCPADTRQIACPLALRPRVIVCPA
jgi:hypothetical protein